MTRDRDYEEARAEVGRLRAALKQLEGWDMLILAPDGSGAVTADAPWARKVIAAALGDEEEPMTVPRRCICCDLPLGSEEHLKGGCPACRREELDRERQENPS